MSKPHYLKMRARGDDFLWEVGEASEGTQILSLHQVEKAGGGGTLSTVSGRRAAFAEPRGLRAWGKDGERRRSQAWERWGGL